MLEAIVDFFTFIVTRPWSLFIAILEWITNFVTVTIPAAIWAMIPAGVAEYLNGLDLPSLAGIVSPITWFFPIWAIMGIYIVAYGMAGSIRLVRFIIGWVPFIEG